MIRRNTALAFVLASIVVSTQAEAQFYDHRACFKVKTDKAFAAAEVDLDAIVVAYGLQGCTLKAKAKMVCLPVHKTIVTLEEGTPQVIPGTVDASESICYSVKCPVGDLPEDTFSDQFGTRTFSKFKPALLCTPATSGALCVPSAEICNNLDDDCNAAIDDGNPGGGNPCSTGMPGVCAQGLTNCSGGMLTCAAVVSPSSETCNNDDDDCNGLVDDGLGTISCGTGACSNTVDACFAGMPQMCTPGVPSAETCNSVDDNCDGSVDDGLGSTSCGVGACYNFVNNCVGGMSQVCVPGTPSAETCNSVDDNCDGMVDEGNPGGGGACATGLPGVCATGTLACVSGSIQCIQNVSPSPEICNGLDDDCDAMIDEGC